MAARALPTSLLAVAILLVACGAATPGGPSAGSQAGGAQPPSQGTTGGASGATSSGGGKAGFDPCSLLTGEEVGSATAIAFAGMGEPALSNGTECKWSLEAGKNVEGVEFERFVDISTFGRSYFEGAAAAGGENVAGIGDQAVYVSDVLVVLKGDRSFALVVNLHEAGNGTDETTAKEHDAAVELGKLAAPRF